MADNPCSPTWVQLSAWLVILSHDTCAYPSRRETARVPQRTYYKHSRHTDTDKEQCLRHQVVAIWLSSMFVRPIICSSHRPTHR
jgi:hypothetical protein